MATDGLRKKGWDGSIPLRHRAPKSLLYVALLVILTPAGRAWTETRMARGAMRPPTPTPKRSAVPLYAGGPSCWADEQGREMIQRFGSPLEDEVEKRHALENLLLSPSRDRLLDAGLDAVDSASSSPLARRRWPVRLPSGRAAIGCYGRILAEMDGGRISAASSDENPFSGDLDSRAWRRDNLLLLLRQLTSFPGGVWSLERDIRNQSGLEKFGASYGDRRIMKC